MLGQGGMGNVWRAFDTVTERAVAVKVLPPHLANSQEYQERFRREAKAAASLREPHVVPIHDLGEIDGQLFVTMRLVDGHDLRGLLANGPLVPLRAVAIIEQIASALHAAHRIGLVHRDVKPSNILVTEDDFAYLIDFGIVQVVGDTGLTSTGMTVGTWPYMAPERFQAGTVDARTDVYSLACVLYQTLTGQKPFPGESLEQVAAGHMFTHPPRPTALRPDIPTAMDRVIATGMAKNPNERFGTTKDLAKAARSAVMIRRSAPPVGLLGPFPPSPPAYWPATSSSPPQHGQGTSPTATAPAEPHRPIGDARTWYASINQAPPSLRAAASVSPAPPTRPATVTSAGVITLLCAAVPGLIGTVGFCDGLSKHDMASVAIGIVFLAIASTLAWGGVAALRGISRAGMLRPLLAITATTALVAVLVLATGSANLLDISPLFAMSGLLALSSWLIRTPSSCAFFARERSRNPNARGERVPPASKHR